MSTIVPTPAGYPAEIIGYAEPWIASPGENVDIKISSTEAEYSYRLVRVVQGVDIPHSPKQQLETVSTVPTGTRRGRFQVAHPGSYGLVHQWPPVAADGGLHLELHFQPYLLQGGGPQAIVSTLNATTKRGFALILTADGQVEFWVGLGNRVEILGTDYRPARERWIKASITILGEDFTATLKPLPHLVEKPRSPLSLRRRLSSPAMLWPAEPLVFAASFAANANSQSSEPLNFFNGRIDSPSISTAGTNAQVLARYDFSRNISSDEIMDISGNRHNGILVNAPTRAVTGFDWDGSEPDWTKATKGYGAIHFHEDDLDDAKWETDFTISLPNDLRSGIYAVEVIGKDQTTFDMVTFIVRAIPQRVKKSEGKVALVLSTFTYLAYANEHLWDKERSSAIDVAPGFDISQVRSTEDFAKLRRRKDLGLSLYDVHRDGSGNIFSTAKRPILNFRPGYIMWAFNRPRELSADSMMVGFLERHGIPYDIVTDHDLHRYGVKAIEMYDVVLTGSHPEYPSPESYSAYQRYASQGGSLMYLGGNGFYWVTALDDSRPWRLEVRRGDQGVRTYCMGGGERFLSLNGAQGGLWRSRDLSSHRLFGVAFCAEGVEAGVPFRRTEAGNGPEFRWMFQDIPDGELIGEYGLGGGASGDEIDSFDIACGSPTNAVVVATSTGHSDGFGIAPECVGFPITGTLGTQTSEIRSDIIYYPTSAGGGIFSVGSINWFCSLGWNDYNNNVATMTLNVIKHLLREARSDKEKSDSRGGKP